MKFLNNSESLVFNRSANPVSYLFTLKYLVCVFIFVVQMPSWSLKHKQLTYFCKGKYPWMPQKWHVCLLKKIPRRKESREQIMQKDAGKQMLLLSEWSKYSGVMFSDPLTWTDHMNYLIHTADTKNDWNINTAWAEVI